MFKNKNLQKIILPLIIIALTLFILTNIPSSIGLFKAILQVLAPVLLGMAFAFVINIPLRRIEALWNKIFAKKADVKIVNVLRRPVCIVLCIILILCILAGLAFLLIPQVLKTVNGLIPKLPEYIKHIQDLWERIVVSLGEHSINLPQWSIDSSKITSAVSKFFSSDSSNIISSSINFAGSLFSFIFDIFFAFVISIYILDHKEKIVTQTKRAFSLLFSEKTANYTFDIILLVNRTFSNFIMGQILEAVILGSLCFVGMLIFRMPYALLISTCITVTALIPIFGAFVGAGIGAFFILLENPIQALWFIVFIIVLQQLEGNLIYPKVVGKKVGLPALWVLIAVTVGANFGIVGMLISVPIFSVVYCLIDRLIHYYERKKKGLLEEDETPFGSLFDDDDDGCPCAKENAGFFSSLFRKIKKKLSRKKEAATDKSKKEIAPDGDKDASSDCDEIKDIAE